MKYESTILKRLIDTYGVVGNHRYISEIIKEFIVRGKECFPNLFTYQADWLAHIDEFGLTPEYTVSYTGQSIYAPNTLERPVKSAILTGQTLVNCLKSQIGTYTKHQIYSTYRDFNLIKSNTCYTFVNNWDKGGILAIRNSDGAYTNVEFTGNSSILFTTPSSINYIEIYSVNSKHGGTQEDCEKWKTSFMIIEGDYTNVDIPYFEGMQSVKMPVLTTSNEDDTKTNILTVNEPVELRGIGEVKDELNCLTGEVTERIGEVSFKSSSGWTLSQESFNNVYEFRYALSRKGVNHKCIGNSFIQGGNGDYERLNVFNVNNGDTTYLFLCINKSKLSSNTLDSLNDYLISNPLTVQYQLANESIKTVDLTILDQNGQNVKQLMSFNGGTHFNTGSSEGSLLPSICVSVETDLEDTLMMCSLEGNTL